MAIWRVITDTFGFFLTRQYTHSSKTVELGIVYTSPCFPLFFRLSLLSLPLIFNARFVIVNLRLSICPPPPPLPFPLYLPFEAPGTALEYTGRGMPRHLPNTPPGVQPEDGVLLQPALGMAESADAAVSSGLSGERKIMQHVAVHHRSPLHDAR